MKKAPSTPRPLELVMKEHVAFLLDRGVPATEREKVLVEMLRGYINECGPRMGAVAVFAMYEEIAPGTGRAAKAYLAGFPETSGDWDGCLFDAGVPHHFHEALNPTPFLSEGV